MNREELSAEWLRITNQVASYNEVDASQVSAFFARLVPQAMSDGFLMLTADNDFLKNWIETHYFNVIHQALHDLYNTDYIVAIEVDTNQQVTADEAPAQAVSQNSTQIPQQQMEKVEETTMSPISPVPTIAREPISEPSSKEQPHKEEKLNDEIFAPSSSLTFENFVIGDSNRMAYSMAVAVAEEPGRQMLNPLFIYGKSGLGKTHLLRAIQNYVTETRPELKTVYVDSGDFLSGYVEATLAHDKEKASFKNFEQKYRDASILLIDDIQFLSGKEQTLDTVFRIFNHMVDEGKQVVLSADRAPKNITMDERYQSRFNSGGTFDIQPPGVETKMGIIKSFLSEYRVTSNKPDFDLPEDISRYIAENSGSNIRELKSAITKIIYAANAFGSEELTVERVSQLLENHFSGGAMKRLQIVDIQKEVERYYDVTHADLIGAKRDRKIMYARKIAIYLSREMLDLPYNTIAKQFGGRDHTTIMHSVSSIEKQINESRETREEIENVKKRIKEM